MITRKVAGEDQPATLGYSMDSAHLINSCTYTDTFTRNRQEAGAESELPDIPPSAAHASLSTAWRS